MTTETFNSFPLIESQRLKLVQLGQNHCDDIFEIFSSEKVTEYYDCSAYTSKDEARNLLALFKQRFTNKTGIRWGITLKDNPKVIGTIGYNRFIPRLWGSIGYDLNDKHWNKGIITEAIKAVTDYGFDELQLHRIEAEVIPGNDASELVLIKNNFSFEGTLRDKGFWKGKYHSLRLFSKLSTDR
jgi:ribosomal-protein-alanine N-acetyltransferase